MIFSKIDKKDKINLEELNNVNKFGKARDERWHVKKDGSLFRASGVITNLVDKTGKVSGHMKILKDITREIETERKIREGDERYKSFLNNSSEGIWRFELEVPLSPKLTEDEQLDSMYKYAYLAECNETLAKMYGFKNSKEIVGARLNEFLIKEDPKNIEYLRNFIKSDYRLMNAESKEVDRAKKIRYFSNNLIGVFENGMITRAWGSQRDITDQYEIIRQKDEFIGVISHELKTPLTSMKGYIQMLSKRFGEKDPELNKYLLKVDTQILKLTKLINESLDVTRIDSGKLQLNNASFNLNTLVKEIVDEVQSITESHTIKVKAKGKALLVNDKDRVGQILINLLSNAIKYSPEANKVIVTTRSNKNSYHIIVKDFGIGIPKSQQDKIFDRFFRADVLNSNTFPGLGLGLYISYELAKRLSGSLVFKSIKGKGSIFNLSLPKTV